SERAKIYARHHFSRRAMNLFDDLPQPGTSQSLADGAVVLYSFATPTTARLIEVLHQVTEAAPFRHMTTPGGLRMSVAMTNCGRSGWVSDRSGYRYQPLDAEASQPWPASTPLFLDLAQRAAAPAGCAHLQPGAC